MVFFDTLSISKRVPRIQGCEPMNEPQLNLILTLVTGICWVIVYIESILIGLKQRTYAMPFWALSLNFSWELFNTVLGYKQDGPSLQVVINATWALFDCGILYTYFRYGKKHFPKNLRPDGFITWSVLGLLTAFLLQLAFIVEFGLHAGSQYSAFLQNLLMSVLFIVMLVQRGDSEGQNLIIGVNKWLGTLAATVMFGVVGGEGFNGASFLILVAGSLCSLFDLIYIVMLARAIKHQKSGKHEALVF
jgi:hypothetical protein